MKPAKEKNNSLPFFGLGKLLPFMRKYKRAFAVMVICSLGASVIDIVVPVLQRYALNKFVGEGRLDSMPYFVLIYVAVILGCAVMTYLCCVKATEIEVDISEDLRNSAFSHLQTLSFSYFNQNSVGYIHARVMSDTGRIGTLVSWTMLDGLWNITYLIGATAVMLVMNARLALLVISVVPLVVLLFAFFQGKLIRLNRDIREINSRITSNFNEGISGAKTIKTLAIEETMEKSFVSETQNMRVKSVKASRVRGAFSATMHFASSLALAIVLWQGGLIARTEIGTFSMFMSYAQGLMEPVRWLVDSITDIITTQVNIERFSKLIELVPDVRDTAEVIEKYGDSFEPRLENWEEIRGDIEFEDVSFKYPDGDEYILEHFNLKIPFGTNVAIVGETGAGKSTLVNLVCRFFEPSSGRLLIDGRDARERSQLWLHSAIGYVLQTPQLFSGTVRENLLYGNPDASDEQISRALKLVSADSLIENLENGLETDVGEGGDLLSTGEKQLISFARAVLAEPRILVLDEATASVDTITEQRIQAALDTIIKDRTSIVVAHRLSTVRNADIILVVKDGKIVERGRHEELMAAKAGYYRLYTRQYEDEITSRILG